MSASAQSSSVQAEQDVPAAPTTVSRLMAEAAGTFVLVFSVVGTALFAAGFAAGTGGLNVGFTGVALALGLGVVVAAYAFGPVSGGHFNPAVTLGTAVAGRLSWREVPGYLLAQVVGALVASSVLAAIAAGGPDGFLQQARDNGFVSTGWGELSPGGFGLPAALLLEVVATCVFVWVILGVTSERAVVGFAPLAIGLTLTVLALIAIPVSDASFNPARSLATAVYGGPTALGQLWMSIVAPIAGAVIAGASFRVLFARTRRG